MKQCGSLLMILWLVLAAAGSMFLVPLPAQAQTNPTVNVQSIRCPACPVVENVFRGAFRLTDSLTTLITTSLQALVAAVLGIWIVLQCAKLLFPFGALERVPNLLNSVFGVVLLAIGILFILSSPSVYKRYLLHPIMDASISASNVVLREAAALTPAVTSGTSSRNPTAAQTGLADNIQKSLGAGSGTTAAGALPPPTATAGTTDFETQITAALVDHIKIAHESLQKGICLGVSNTGLSGCMNAASGIIAKTGRKVLVDSVISFLWSRTLPGAIQSAWNKFTGNDVRDAGVQFMKVMAQIGTIFLVIIIYGLIWLKYPLYVLDVVLKWAILSILWPLMVAGLLLPALRPMTFAALKGLGHAALTLVFMAAVIGTSLSVMDQMWNEIEWAQGKNVTLSTEVLGHPDYWLVVFTGLILQYLLKECPRMAGAFIDSSMDLQVSEGIWQKTKAMIWFVADVATAGKAGRFKRVLNIK
jgi:hypothetical protein